jgi:centromere protein C
MHMVFYVCHGRVQVDISGVQFSAGKGCVFQIPRGEFPIVSYDLQQLIYIFSPGNYYSFANTHHKEARLFFTQGCVPDESESENENDTQAEIDNDNDMSAVSHDASPESEVEPEAVPAPVKKAKGRPKGKQKKAGK